MLGNLTLMANNANRILICGSGCDQVIRNMLQHVNGAYTLNMLEGPYNEDRAIHSDIPVINVIKIKYWSTDMEVNISARNRFWVVKETIGDFETQGFECYVLCDQSIIQKVSYVPREMSYEDIKREYKGVWYANIMQLYSELEFRVGYNPLANFLIQVYSFIEYSCTDTGLRRCSANVVNKLGCKYKDYASTSFQLRLAYVSEPYQRKQIWTMMINILDSPEFYELLQLYFRETMNILNGLHYIRGLAVMEMDKEGFVYKEERYG